jgi:hypothetical protein
MEDNMNTTTNITMKAKRRLALFVAVIMALTIWTATPTQASAATSGDFEYSVSNGTATITYYYGNATYLTIPSTLGGYPVTGIGEEGFYYCLSLRTVTIPNSVTSIGENAFYGCESLTIWCYSGSVAQQYADTNGIAYVSLPVDIPDVAITNELTSFYLAGTAGSINGTIITVELPYGTQLTSLIPIIGNNGKSTYPLVSQAQDFTKQAMYTVTAENGDMKTYTVIVTIASPQIYEVTVTNGSGSSLFVKGADVTITANAAADNKVFDKWTSSDDVDFANANSATTTFTMPAKAVTATYKENVKITLFTLAGVNGTINGTNITLTVPSETNLTSLIPTIKHNGAYIATTGAQNFTNFFMNARAEDSPAITYKIILSAPCAQRNTST